MPRVNCIVCGQPFDAIGRGCVCSADCRRARRRAYDAGVSATAGGLPPPMSTCDVCGKQFAVPRGVAKACSPECLQERRRRKARESKRREYERRGPEIVAAAKARLRASPERRRLYDARKYQRHRERMATNQEYAERYRQRQREGYARDAERIQAKRRAKIAAMSDAELAERMERMRGYSRDYHRRTRHDPRCWDERREYAQEYRRRRNAARMAGDAATLEALLAGRETGKRVKPCSECGQPVVGKHPSAKTCGAECRQARYVRLGLERRATTIACAVCGKSFLRRTASRCCSPDCKRARRLGVSVEELQGLCARCGKTFVRKIRRQRFCSRVCQYASGDHGPRPPRPCIACGNQFTPDRHNGKTCSAECRAEAKRRVEKIRSKEKRDGKAK